MSMIEQTYKSLFRRIRGHGLGLGIFNKIHWLYESNIQSKSVEVNGMTLFLPKHCNSIGEKLRMDGVWEPEVTNAMTQCLRPGMTFIDIGANIGYHSLLASKLVGPTGQVIAFEADPANIELLRKNRGINKANNIKAYELAIGKFEHWPMLNLCSTSPGGHSLVYKPQKYCKEIIVHVVSLDKILRTFEYPDVMKIDIEGGEEDALDGMPMILESKKLETIFIELNSPILSTIGKTPFDIMHKLNNYGFSGVKLDPINWVFTR